MHRNPVPLYYSILNNLCVSPENPDGPTPASSWRGVGFAPAWLEVHGNTRGLEIVAVIFADQVAVVR